MRKKVRNTLMQTIARRRDYTMVAYEQFPDLAPYISEYEDLANSLIDTGNHNYLVGDGEAFIDTCIQFGRSNCDTFKVTLYTKPSFTFNVWNIHGLTGNDTLAIGFDPSCYLVYSDGRTLNTGPYSRSLIDRRLRMMLDFSNGKFEVDDITDKTNVTAAYHVLFTPITPSGETNFYLYRYNASGSSTFASRISEVVFEYHGEKHRLVPFRKSNGQCVLLDLFNLTFHGNQNTRGSFTIVTE